MLLYTFKTIFIKSPAGMLIEIENQIPKCIWKYRGCRITLQCWKKKEQSWKTFLQDFVTWHSAEVVQDSVTGININKQNNETD